MSDLDKLLDAALGDVLSSGWDDEPSPEKRGLDQHQVAAPQFPPLPMKEPAKPRQKPAQGATPTSAMIEASAPPSALHPRDPDDDEEPGENDDHATFGVGLLTDLAMGRKTPQQAAESAGVSLSVLEDALASTLRDSSADDIATALAIQASEQQLKSGAIYGSVLFDLVRDMKAGRLQPKEKIKFAELLAAVGRVMPKESKDVSGSGAFVLNINLGQAEPRTIVLDNG